MPLKVWRKEDAFSCVMNFGWFEFERDRDGICNFMNVLVEKVHLGDGFWN